MHDGAPLTETEQQLLDGIAAHLGDLRPARDLSWRTTVTVAALCWAALYVAVVLTLSVGNLLTR